MNETRGVRERHAWIAVVAVLATSMVWLAAVNVALLLQGHGFDTPAAVVVGRALLHAAVLLVERCWLMLPAGIAASAGIVMIVRTTGAHRSQGSEVRNG